MKVLIVGAGIAGPTGAYWLLRAGHDVTLVEQAPQLRRGGYLVDFWGAGFDVAERMGLVPELRRRGYALTEARAVDRSGHRIASIRPAMIMGSKERYVSIARSDLAAVIFEALGGAAKLILDDTVTVLDDDGDRVAVQFASGRSADFDLVIGADGLHSTVRRLVFGPEERFERYLGIVIAAFEVERYRPRNELIAIMYAEVGFQVVRLSLRADVTLFLVSVRHAGPVPRDEEAAQVAVVQAALDQTGWETREILDVMSRADNFYFDSVSQIRLSSWSRGRVVLVGDAAAAPSFLAGQGSALAMVESYTLAAELARPGEPADAFDRYFQRLAKLLRSKQDAATGLGAAFAPRNRRQLFLRNTVLKLMALPKVPDLVMGRSFRDAVELPSFRAAS